MKVFIAILALSASSAFAAPDYYGMCKTELTNVADRFSSYIGSQSSECLNELNKPASERSNQVIVKVCTNANGLLAPIRQRAIAVCGQCRRLNDPRINETCTDNGVTSFIEAAHSL